MRPTILMPLFASLTSRAGVGPKIYKHYERLCGGRVVDLLCHLPIALQHRRFISQMRAAEIGQLVSVVLTVGDHFPPPDRMTRARPYKVNCFDDTGSGVDLAFFHARPEYLIRQLPPGEKRLISGKVERFQHYRQITHPDFIGSPSEAANWQGFEPIYPLTHGLSHAMLLKLMRDVLSVCPDLPEWIPEKRRACEGWTSWKEAILEVHHPQGYEDLNPGHRARRRLAYDELLAHQVAFTLIRHHQKKTPGQAQASTGVLRKKFLDTLPFSLTQGQTTVLAEIDRDMAAPSQMVRLLQGDVGSGKTVVAMLAMLTAVENGSQAAILAPTELLARQHHQTLTPWAEALGIRLGLITRQGKGRRGVREDLEAGKIDIAIGTHALIQEEVRFRNLSCAVVDEQHRFGVDQRLSLARKGQRVDILVMTATPIPRTLLLAAQGDLATSTLREKPKNRQEIVTKVLPLGRLEEVAVSLERALAQNRKIYWVCPLVGESEALDLAAVEERFQELIARFPDQVGLVHGRMKAAEKEAAMTDFINGKTRILVATTVIEVGVHVSDASIMIIEHAERFGLAQLHQLRGRIGRGSLEAPVCLLLYGKAFGKVAQQRLKVMKETNDGFRIAEADLRLRGGGEALGLRQSGLPRFRFVDWEHHQDLLLMAHDDAQAILATDPSLSSSHGNILRILLYLFEKEASVVYLKAG